MRFTTSTAALLALVSRVVAQIDGFDAITKPTKNEVLEAGSTYQITWDYSAQYAGTISITLLEGDTPSTLELGDTIASGIDNSVGSYSWTVDSTLGDDTTYGLEITLDSNSTIFQYSFPFSIAASSEGSSSSSTVATTASTSTASSISVSSTSSPSSTSSESSDSSTSSSDSTTSATSAETTSSETTWSETASSETTWSETASSETSAPTATTTSATKSAASTGFTKSTMTSGSSASSTGSGTTSSSSPIVTAGAGKVVAGTFAAMGGLAAALLAL